MGRFGDLCRKIRFSDCPDLVDKVSQASYNAKLFSFVSELKNKVLVQPVSGRSN